ncbi:MAG: NAD-dependent epimerase/dehydratase family protein [Gemmatimonadota bacterium]|nr:NAD-dependent epimerase/dehydratase family protein [Gemmatimonadota bacterium]
MAPEGTAKGPPSSRPVLVTGATGFLGTWVMDVLTRSGVVAVGVGRAHGDLRELDEALALLERVRPGTIVHLAGLVGGIGIHGPRGGELVRDNVLMGLQILEAGRRADVERVILAGTAAAYPQSAPVPSREADLDSGMPGGTSRPYALAKRTVEEALRGYRTQYGMRGGTLVFTNLYGPGDHFGSEGGHVVAALVPRFVAAVETGADVVTVWGSGAPTRDFLFVEDGARAVFLSVVSDFDSDVPVNVGSGRETSIRVLAETLARVTGFEGRIVWDPSKPDGAPRRALDPTRAEEVLGFRATTSLADGLASTVEAYRSSGPGGRFSG